MNNKTPGRSVRCFDIFKGNRLVLKVEDRPGTLLSTAPLPPGIAKPVEHPFVNAQAYDAASENELRQLLMHSKSFDEYIKALTDAGYKAIACVSQ